MEEADHETKIEKAEEGQMKEEAGGDTKGDGEKKWNATTYVGAAFW